MFDEDSGFTRKKSKAPEAELDITPMIDVTFLLLIFFMVTSTMQGTPDKDIPPSISGSSRNAAGMLELLVLAPLTAGGNAELRLEGKPATLEEVKLRLVQEAAAKEAEVMVLAERMVPSGLIGEVESALNEVENVKYHFAVQDRK